MKKISFLLITMWLAIPGFAQEGDKYHIGVKVSPNLGWIKPDTKYLASTGNVFRFGFGLVMDIHFTDNYAFGTGLNISQCGGKAEYFRKTNEAGFDQISFMQRTYKLQYGEIPFTLKLRTNEIGYITYWGQFGLGLGVNIRAKADDEIDYRYSRSGNDGTTWEQSALASRSLEDEDIKDDISLFRTSLIIAAGIEYTVSGKTALMFGVTFNNGFSDALKNNALQKDDRDEVIFGGVGSTDPPVTAKLKGVTNFLELNIGVMF
jgi:hypothetical protein